MSEYQRRRAPAFQEYAADMLANAQFRMMTLEEKGLLTILRYECWVNDRVPAQYSDLGLYLGVDSEKISTHLTAKVLTFFKAENEFLVCPELDSYRAKLMERTKKLAEAGSAGGKKTQKIKANQACPEASLKPVSRDEINKDEKKLNDIKPLNEGVTNQLSDPWIDEYNATPHATNLYINTTR
ncbi:hypothetical protein [Polynucleobacter acidiphobus]|uniref:hypothetical protein n=1 Tax=Polynucleobacter acidiphobus TaxID=556053 RepID=UPI000D3C5551|nr:hypothetical protein [Polynucleobacter acidiphobus]